MLILGAVLLIVGLVLGIKILWVVGLVIAAVGAVFMLSGSRGHAVGGRRYWY